MQDEIESEATFACLFPKAVELFEGYEEAARRWMNAPCRALGDDSPLEYAQTEQGAREVERLIARLEHGVIT